MNANVLCDTKILFIQLSNNEQTFLYSTALARIALLQRLRTKPNCLNFNVFVTKAEHKKEFLCGLQKM